MTPGAHALLKLIARDQSLQRVPKPRPSDDLAQLERDGLVRPYKSGRGVAGYVLTNAGWIAL